MPTRSPNGNLELEATEQKKSQAKWDQNVS